MFGLFSKKETPVDFSLIKTDMHSHVLPGIDDGSPDIETSIELIKGLKDLGYTTIITTPHILWDMYKNTPAIIEAKTNLINKELQARNIDIQIKAAAEYFLDEHVSNLLAKKEPLLTIKDNMVLVEFSVMHLSINMKEILFDIQMAGYQPILAHPERYAYLYKNWDVFDELKSNGCYFQLNLLSLSGGYGKTVMDMAQYFIKNDFYNMVGTDMHHTGHLQRLKSLKASPHLQNLLNNGTLINTQL